jgi:hypothetical protein
MLYSDALAIRHRRGLFCGCAYFWDSISVRLLSRQTSRLERRCSALLGLCRRRRLGCAKCTPRFCRSGCKRSSARYGLTTAVLPATLQPVRRPVATAAGLATDCARCTVAHCGAATHARTQTPAHARTQTPAHARTQTPAHTRTHARKHLRTHARTQTPAHARSHARTQTPAQERVSSGLSLER